MDLSKLPRLSQSEAPPPSEEAPPPAEAAKPAAAPVAVAPYPGALRPGLMEAWISIGVGVILLLVVPTTLQYFSSKVFHTHFAPYGDPERPPPAKVDYLLFSDGTTTTKVYYRDTVTFWSDLAVTAFSLVLILDGILMVRARSVAVIGFALCLTLAATLGNLVYLVSTYSSNGIAILSALAVLFGGYIAMSQWGMLSGLLRARAPKT